MQIDTAESAAQHCDHEHEAEGGPAMGRLYDIIQAHIDAQPYGTSVRKVAEAIGVSPTTVANWRNLKELPSKENLEAIARVTGTSYQDVFYAAGVDTGYVIETVVQDTGSSTKSDTA